MSPNAEVHLLFSAVRHLVGDPEAVSLKLIDDAEGKYKRVAGERPFIRVQTQHQADGIAVRLPLRLLRLRRHFRRRQEAVDGKLIRLSVNRAGSPRQSCDIGEQVRRLPLPVGGIPLP